MSLIALSAHASIKAESVGKIVAKVNNEVITSVDLDEYCNFIQYRNPEVEFTPQLKEDVLDGLIQDKLILSQAKQEEIEVPQEWLAKRMDEFITSYPSQEEFEASLAIRGLNISMLKKKLSEQYLTRTVLDKYVRSKIDVSPQEVTDFYSAHRSEFSQPKTYVIWIGKTQDRATLDLLGQQIEEGGLASVNGEQKILNKIEVEEESLKEEIKNIVATLDEGAWAIEKVDDYYYLVYLESVLPESKIPLIEVKDQIHALVWQEKFDRALGEWIVSLKEEAVIKIYD
jgi:parvulin-like peptidyl-prolyl isomerase